MKNKKICVIGLGYIGLPTAAVLANNGYNVAGIDLNLNVVEIINQGRIHIIEPELDHLVKNSVSAGSFKAYSTPQAADIYIICVPTPFREKHGVLEPNIDYVLSAARSLAPFLKCGDLIILESTSPVGTTEEVQKILLRSGVDISGIYLAYCPERVLPGKITTELIENDRVVGGLTSESTKIASSFYKTFILGDVLETDAKTAEMCKLAENSFRDVNIAFANELSMICDKEGINVWNLIALANKHPRVNILQPGAGVGGHCIAVDPWFIVARNPENSQLIKSAREVNNYKTLWTIEKIKVAVEIVAKKSLEKPRIVCLGLAFKPDIDDLRESPAVSIVRELDQQGYDVAVVEPNIDQHSEFKLLSFDEASETADIFVLLVKHREFISDKVRCKLMTANVLDFCGALL